jgi:steroid 5-alpha reductase family enzyme
VTFLGIYTRHPNYFGDATQWWGFYPGYREYIETTSAFVPWFPRKRR